VATETAIFARARELLAQVAPDAPVSALRLELAALGEAAIQLSFPLPLARDGAPRPDLETVAERLRGRFGPRAARRVRLAPVALLPEEQVIWDEPTQKRGQAPRALTVRIDAGGRPTALRRAAGSGEQEGDEAGAGPGGSGWEPIRAVCAHWRLRTRWWARTTHRYYYLVETMDGALLEIYQEQEDGRWWLTGRRD
jgi:hypothetical protein